MKQRFFRLFVGAAAPIALALALVPAEGLVSHDQMAAASQWTFYVSNLGAGCDSDCCGGLSLCCDVPTTCDD